MYKLAVLEARTTEKYKWYAIGKTIIYHKSNTYPFQVIEL